MENTSFYTAVLACVMLAGVALNRFSSILKMPILICFLGIGVVCGQYGMDIFPKFETDKLQQFGEMALAFIIFSGGLQTSAASIKKVFVTGTILSTVGVVLTAMLFGVFVFWVCQSSLFPTATFSKSLLIGAIVSSTDAAAVFAILRGRKANISPKLQSLLEYESGSNDPAAFLLTSIMLQVYNSTSAMNFSGISLAIFTGILWGLGIGSALGFLLGLFGQWFYNWIHSFLEYNGLRFVVAIAIVMLCSSAAECFHANTLMSCYVAGITMGNLRFNFKQSFINFHEGVSWLMQIMLFTILGSLFNFRMLFHAKIILTALVSALMLMVIARPLAVIFCMIKSPFNMRERLFTSWVGLRGSTPIMLALLVLSSVPEEETIYAQRLFYVVFIIVLLSIIFQGSSLMWVARKLGLLIPYKEPEEQLLEYDERSDGREMNQFVIREGNSLIDRKIGPFEMENNLVLLMIKRGSQFIQPTPEVILKKGDVLSFLGKREAMLELHSNFFPEEPYSSPLTFQQLCEKMTKKITRKRPPKDSSHIAKK